MVSVIIPVYNGQKYLASCVRSVQIQTHRDLEIVIVDDGSVDATFSLCEEMAKRDPRIRFFRQENAGVSAARNLALEKANGEYILFADADDLLMPDAVKILLDAAECGSDFVMGQHVLFRGFHSEIWGSRPCTLTFPLESDAGDIQKLASLVCGQMYRSSIIREYGIRFPEGLPYGEDTVFNLRFFRCAERGRVLKKLVYRRRKGGAASSLRCYPNRDEIALTLIRAYGACFTDRNILRAVLESETLDTVSHYLIHFPYRQAKEKTETFFQQIRSAYPDDMAMQTGRQVMRAAWKKKGKQILLRKLRKAVYAIRKKAECENRNCNAL